MFNSMIMRHLHLFFPVVLAFASVLIITESSSFEFSSGAQEYNVAYQLAISEVSQNIENGVFIAGAGWKQLWTRDTSYAVELGAGLVRPDLAKSSLQHSIERDPELGEVWLQDECGHFGGWPNLSDAIVGVRGAWSLYVITGDEDFLSWAYNVTKNSLARGERDVYDGASGLFRGCSSFMESDSGYPEKYSHNGTLVGMTKALSTNMLHYAGYKLGAKMAEQLHAKASEIRELNHKAQELRDKIRSRLWSSDQGYYSYFEDENNELVPQMEGLGESLVLLDPDFEQERVDSIFASTFRSERGLPCLWPRFKTPVRGIPSYYHNGRIWPFVQGYWGLAAARHSRVDVFGEELANMVWLSQQRNTFAEFYELNGSFPEKRSRQLWSDAGFLSMVFHGLFGMTFLPEGVQFNPVKPASPFAETIALRGVAYREMTLDIYVRGSGSNIAFITVNGQESPNFIRGNATGTFEVVITLLPPYYVHTWGDFDQKDYALVVFACTFVTMTLSAIVICRRKFAVPKSRQVNFETDRLVGDRGNVILSCGVSHTK